MREPIRKRLAELEALRGDVVFDPDVFGGRLESALDRALRQLTGEADRDIVHVEGSLEESRSGFRFEGHGADGTRRFWCVIYYDIEPARLNLNIAVTKGTQEASLDCFGQSGRDFGNRLVVARALDVLLKTAIESGVKQLDNKPWDDRVRAIYAAMGFAKGERLALSDPDHLRLALEFIKARYDLAAAEHAAFTPPW